MTIRTLLASAALACAPALHAQEIILQPDVLFAAADTLYVVQTIGGTRDTIATSVQTMRRVTEGGRELWEVEYVFSSAAGSVTDTTTFDAATLLPHTQRRVAADRRIEVDYAGAEVRIRRLQAGVEGPPAEVRRYPQPVFAGSVMDVVYRALPLADGYRARVPFAVPESDQTWWFDVHVTGPQAVETRDGPVQAWRVEAGAAGATPDVFWISRDRRVLLRAEHIGGMATIR